VVRAHGENFPVASYFLPRDKRPYVCAIYAFARIADDFADEGNLSREERLERLDGWGQMLDDCYRGRGDHPVFIALAETAAKTGIPKQLLVDLLSAFRLDVTKTRYKRFAEVLQYCTLSANPVGRLVLHVCDDATEQTLPLSDAICTGLQLANFLQDFSVDWRKGRLYTPLDDLSQFDYTERDIQGGVADERFRTLMRFQVNRARQFLHNGSPLVRLARKDLRFELALTVRGGLAILDAIGQIGFDVLHRRPSLSLIEKGAIVVAAIADRKA